MSSAPISSAGGRRLARLAAVEIDGVARAIGARDVDIAFARDRRGEHGVGAEIDADDGHRAFGDTVRVHREGGVGGKAAGAGAAARAQGSLPKSPSCTVRYWTRTFIVEGLAAGPGVSCWPVGTSEAVHREGEGRGAEDWQVHEAVDLGTEAGRSVPPQAVVPSGFRQNVVKRVRRAGHVAKRAGRAAAAGAHVDAHEGPREELPAPCRRS